MFPVVGKGARARIHVFMENLTNIIETNAIFYIAHRKNHCKIVKGKCVHESSSSVAASNVSKYLPFNGLTGSNVGRFHWFGWPISGLQWIGHCYTSSNPTT